MKKISFLLDVALKERSLPRFIDRITNSDTSEYFSAGHEPKDQQEDLQMLSIYDLPGYFQLGKAGKPASLSVFSASLYYGYAIDLHQYANFEDFLLRKVRKARYSQLRRYKKRLNICLKPEYKIFYGSIDREEYDFLFNALRTMIERRFEEKEEMNFELPYLDLYQSVMYPLILRKRAALFAIYCQSQPICITLNFILNRTVLHWNSAYDIDYSMFNLGHINTFNHVEWSFKNHFTHFDMGRGDFFHKRKWVDKRYCYRQEICVVGRNPLRKARAALLSSLLSTRFHLINTLKRLKLHLLFSKMYKFRYRLKNKNNSSGNWSQIIILEEGSEFRNLTAFAELQSGDSKTTQLLKSRNYFLHQNQEYLEDLVIRRKKDDDKVFAFLGKNHYRIVKLP